MQERSRGDDRSEIVVIVDMDLWSKRFADQVFGRELSDVAFIKEQSSGENLE